MVGDVDHIDAVLDAEFGVFGAHDALQHQRYVGNLAHLVEHVPVELLAPFGIAAAARVVGAGVQMADQVALAAAVMIAIDGDAEPLDAEIDAAQHIIPDPVEIAEHIELEQPMIARFGADLPHARFGDAGLHEIDAEFARRPRRQCGAAVADGVQPADRR